MKYQISFHDLVALNQGWLKDKTINRELLNQHLDDIELFLQGTVILNNQNCQLNLINQSPWSSVTFANERYMVISARTGCQVNAIEHIEVVNVWAEFPDHKVIAEIKLPKIEKVNWVLSIDSSTIN
ncbi:hypothetical protein [Idiomarina sp. A28L]|uniref:hypothetical protein n=1 Tax=Idiomarina sp. A28L TaxID=1036674 RepID=UPI001112C0EC|nr:hypothetical protein [Idiomarina sp. A28L]